MVSPRDCRLRKRANRTGQASGGTSLLADGTGGPISCASAGAGPRASVTVVSVTTGAIRTTRRFIAHGRRGEVSVGTIPDCHRYGVRQVVASPVPF